MGKVWKVQQGLLCDQTVWQLQHNYLWLSALSILIETISPILQSLYRICFRLFGHFGIVAFLCFLNIFAFLFFDAWDQFSSKDNVIFRSVVLQICFCLHVKHCFIWCHLNCKMIGGVHYEWRLHRVLAPFGNFGTTCAYYQGSDVYLDIRFDLSMSFCVVGVLAAPWRSWIWFLLQNLLIFLFSNSSPLSVNIFSG